MASVRKGLLWPAANILCTAAPPDSTLANNGAVSIVKPLPSNPERTKLATGFSVHDYQVARDAQDSLKISEAIRKRFTERYISPVADAEGKTGFAMMAISCLIIEA